MTKETAGGNSEMPKNGDAMMAMAAKGLIPCSRLQGLQWYRFHGLGEAWNCQRWMRKIIMFLTKNMMWYMEAATHIMRIERMLD
jgi:hypothetical protein